MTEKLSLCPSRYYAGNAGRIMDVSTGASYGKGQLEPPKSLPQRDSLAGFPRWSDRGLHRLDRSRIVGSIKSAARHAQPRSGALPGW